MSSGILIHIVHNGKDFGLRRWPAVPRIGERVVVAQAGKTFALKVAEVLWGVTTASRDGTECEVDVILKGALK